MRLNYRDEHLSPEPTSRHCKSPVPGKLGPSQPLAKLSTGRPPSLKLRTNDMIRTSDEPSQ